VLHPIELGDLLQLGEAAQILDVRDAAEYAKDHLAGSINIDLGGQYAMGGDGARPRETDCHRRYPGANGKPPCAWGALGLDHVKGYLKGGMEALAGRPDLVADAACQRADAGR
jgi:rhodanese-related sulfurtransferase